jgi:hypothetical protein
MPRLAWGKARREPTRVGACARFTALEPRTCVRHAVTRPRRGHVYLRATLRAAEGAEESQGAFGWNLSFGRSTRHAGGRFTPGRPGASYENAHVGVRHPRELVSSSPETQGSRSC